MGDERREEAQLSALSSRWGRLGGRQDDGSGSSTCWHGGQTRNQESGELHTSTALDADHQIDVREERREGATAHAGLPCEPWANGSSANAD